MSTVSTTNKLKFILKCINVLEEKSEKVLPGPWYYNPYRATIGQHAPDSTDCTPKDAAILLHPAAHTSKNTAEYIADIRTITPMLLTLWKYLIQDFMEDLKVMTENNLVHMRHGVICLEMITLWQTEFGEITEETLKIHE